MTESGALYRLLTWLSPSYPVGAYTYSHGLEQAVEAGLVTDARSARDWISDCVELGTGYSDALLLAEAYRAGSVRNTDRLRNAAELAAAFVPSRELALETEAQGAAFIQITEAVWETPPLKLLQENWDGPVAYPVAVGCTAAGHKIALEDALTGYLHAFAANLVSAAVRLVPLGQTDGQKITATLEQVVAETALRARKGSVDDIASSTLMVDICSMNHETQHTRLFRS